jgi:hypothetical protein
VAVLDKSSTSVCSNGCAVCLAMVQSYQPSLFEKYLW